MTPHDHAVLTEQEQANDRVIREQQPIAVCFVCLEPATMWLRCKAMNFSAPRCEKHGTQIISQLVAKQLAFTVDGVVAL